MRRTPIPFINGRFYINPAYGRAVEAARAAEAARDAAPNHDQEQQQQAGHWVTINHRHVFIHEREGKLANIIYNETASLHPGTRATPGGKGSPEDLQSARQAVGEIANRVVKAGHPERVAPSELAETEKNAVAAGNPDAVAAYNGSLAAARQALAGSNITNGATRLRMRKNGDIHRPIEGQSVNAHYGPFLDKRPHEAPKTMVVAP